MKGIILHGGAGTRLRPLTFSGPKQLIPIANRPVSRYALEDLRDSGIRDIAVVLGETYPELVKELLRANGYLVKLLDFWKDHGHLYVLRAIEVGI